MRQLVLRGQQTLKKKCKIKYVFEFNAENFNAENYRFNGNHRKTTVIN